MGATGGQRGKQPHQETKCCLNGWWRYPTAFHSGNIFSLRNEPFAGNAPEAPLKRSYRAVKTVFFSLKITDGFPCHPGRNAAPAQSIHMDLDVRMDGRGPPPPKQTNFPLLFFANTFPKCRNRAKASQPWLYSYSSIMQISIILKIC